MRRHAIALLLAGVSGLAACENPIKEEFERRAETRDRTDAAPSASGPATHEGDGALAETSSSDHR
jgi:hypothetical protein